MVKRRPIDCELCHFSRSLGPRRCLVLSARKDKDDLNETLINGVDVAALDKTQESTHDSTGRLG